VNGTLGETLIVVAGLNGIAPWVLAVYAIKRGWRLNTSPEKPKPTADQIAAALAQPPAGAAVPAGANGAAS
jgi:hypothetical protein